MSTLSVYEGPESSPRSSEVPSLLSPPQSGSFEIVRGDNHNEVQGQEKVERPENKQTMNIYIYSLLSAQVHLDKLDRTLLCLKRKENHQSSESMIYTVQQVQL